MSDAKSFNCPNCGSPLVPSGTAKEVRCTFCGSSVILPEELRDQNLYEHHEMSPEDDLFSPRHVQWLIENGADATVKVDIVKDAGETHNMNPVVVLYLIGKKAAGGKFEGSAEINVPRTAIPRRGTTIKIKYKPAHDYFDDADDFALQIDGQFYYKAFLMDGEIP